MVFTIYDDSTGGTALWRDSLPSVVVEKGVFSVLLGSVNPIPDTVFPGDVRYLGVKVGADSEMTPRKAIVSVAYAYKATIGDNDWTFRITDTADTTLVTGGRWGIARSGNLLFGNADSTHVNLGVVCTTGTSGVNHRYCTVGGGLGNTASGGSATVGGGGGNTASGTGAAVAGGTGNTAAGDHSFAAGSGVNIDSTADYTFAFGKNFTTSTPHSVIFYDADSEIKVGIQVANPTNILTVKQNSTTGPIADAWTTHSSREYKRDIHELTPGEYQEALKKVVSVPVVKFHYKGEDTKEKIGVIAEEAPEEILAEGDNKAISLNEYISLLHAAVKAQQEKLEVLKTKLEKLESNH